LLDFVTCPHDDRNRLQLRLLSHPTAEFKTIASFYQIIRDYKIGGISHHHLGSVRHRTRSLGAQITKFENRGEQSGEFRVWVGRSKPVVVAAHPFLIPLT